MSEGYPCTVRSKLNKFEHVWGQGQSRRGSFYMGQGLRGRYKGFEARGILGWWGPMHHRLWSHGTLPLVDRMTDRHNWKHYLSPTLLAGGNHQIFPTKLLNIMKFPMFLRRWTVRCEGSGETLAAVRPGLWLHFSRSDGAIRSVSDAFHPRNSAQKSGRKWLRRKNNDNDAPSRPKFFHFNAVFGKNFVN